MIWWKIEDSEGLYIFLLIYTACPTNLIPPTGFEGSLCLDSWRNQSQLTQCKWNQAPAQQCLTWHCLAVLSELSAPLWWIVSRKSTDFERPGRFCERVGFCLDISVWDHKTFLRFCIGGRNWILGYCRVLPGIPWSGHWTYHTGVHLRWIYWRIEYKWIHFQKAR